MDKRDLNVLRRVISILGTIFCLAALLTPWSSFAFTYGVFGSEYSTPFYIRFFTDETIKNDVGLSQAVIFATIMIIIFLLIISSLIYGITFIKSSSDESPDNYLWTSIFLIVSIILYIVAVSISPDISKYTGSPYNAGFTTAIISFITFFIVFIFQSVFHQKHELTTEIKSEDETMKILKLRYAKGEITKKDYEQIKEDLEDK
jgi:uncharacterized membrane protein